MKIGIDISQIAYTQTGVANYLKNLVTVMAKNDKNNEYVLFYSSLRRPMPKLVFTDQDNITIKKFRFPPVILDVIWNRLHMFPIEWFIGSVDVFISSDWTQPPARKAKLATILYDLIVLIRPLETDEKIVTTQKRKLAWVTKDCDAVFCISESTKKDAQKLLGIAPEKLHITYPGGVL